MDLGDAISELEWFVWNFGELWQLTGRLLCNKTKPNLVNLLIFKRYFWWLDYFFFIRSNFNNVYTSIQSFFEFRNGQLLTSFWIR